MGSRDDSMFCGTALDVRDILRVRGRCISGVSRPLKRDGPALNRLCNDIRFWLARGVLELCGDKQMGSKKRRREGSTWYGRVYEYPFL